MILLLTRFLHVLVFVYWLGGDLGAFYSAGLLTDRRRATEGRLAAAQVLFRVDLAPNTALILAAPTGVALALAKGWLAFPPLWLVPIWLAALAWLVVSWRLHLIQQPQPSLSTLDFWVRCGLILVLVSLGGCGLAGIVSLPLFLSLKLLILAAATVLGLIVRHFLKAFTPAFMALATGAGTAETDDVIADTLGKSRYAVLGIWTLLAAAALLGIAAPVSA